MHRRYLTILLTIAALTMAACGEKTTNSNYTPPLMTVTVLDSMGVPVPGLSVGSINHSDYITRPLPPPTALPATEINFSLPEATVITLAVYNYYNELIKTLVDNQEYPAGSHSFPWDTSDLPGGYYCYRLTTPDTSMTHWVVLDRGWDPGSTILGETNAEGKFPTSDTLLFPCLLGDPPTVDIRDDVGNLLGTTNDFYSDTVTFHLSDPAAPGVFYFYDRALQTAPNEITLIWEP